MFQLDVSLSMVHAVQQLLVVILAQFVQVIISVFSHKLQSVSTLVDIQLRESLHRRQLKSNFKSERV